jgi:phosphoribosylanthranilate isomerase
MPDTLRRGERDRPFHRETRAAERRARADDQRRVVSCQLAQPLGHALLELLVDDALERVGEQRRVDQVQVVRAGRGATARIVAGPRSPARLRCAAMEDEPPRIKFCGLTNLDDAQLAVEAGAWALGMILWPGSPRHCEPIEAVRIATALKRGGPELVGVFVNPTLDEVSAAADTIGITMIQLHGDEGPVFCAEVARRTGCQVIKAIPVGGKADMQAIEAFHTDYHLLDAHRAGKRGGTGETFDWELVRSRRSRIPLVLSGGLHAGNVAEAIAATQPYAVDVASGTESAPGVKDPAKLIAFAEAVRASAEVAA